MLRVLSCYWCVQTVRGYLKHCSPELWARWSHGAARLQLFRKLLGECLGCCAGLMPAVREQSPAAFCGKWPLQEEQWILKHIRLHAPKREMGSLGVSFQIRLQICHGHTAPSADSCQRAEVTKHSMEFESSRTIFLAQVLVTAQNTVFVK